MLTEKLTPKELVLKHIFDRNHIVTEEELKNVKVGFLNEQTEESSDVITNVERPQLTTAFSNQ